MSRQIWPNVTALRLKKCEILRELAGLSFAKQNVRFNPENSESFQSSGRLRSVSEYTAWYKAQPLLTINALAYRVVEMDDTYDTNGIALKPWFAIKPNENIYYLTVLGWSYPRRVIERDRLVCFQVTVHRQDSCCFTCTERVCFVKEQLAVHNVQCFWTREPKDGSLYVTVGPPPDSLSVEKYLSFLLKWPIIMDSRPEEGRSKRRKKGGSRNRRYIVQ